MEPIASPCCVSFLSPLWQYEQNQFCYSFAWNFWKSSIFWISVSHRLGLFKVLLISFLQLPIVMGLFIFGSLKVWASLGIPPLFLLVQDIFFVTNQADSKVSQFKENNHNVVAISAITCRVGGPFWNYNYSSSI